MNSRLLAYAQTGLEGARWLRDDAEVGGTFRAHLINGSLREAGLVAVKNALQLMPDFDVNTPIRLLVDSQHEVVGVGSEALVVMGEDGRAHKFLTGKSQEPEILVERIKDLDARARQYLGEFLPETSATRETAKLFKGLSPKDYVKLTQPFIEIEHVDPNRDPALLQSRPEIKSALADLADKLVELFEEEGLLMDIINRGNLAWGCIGDGSSQLYLLDTVPVDYTEQDFTGIKVPFWSPDMHLEYLVDFVEASHPDKYFNHALVERWLYENPDDINFNEHQ
jgi:hypothetical protein